MDLTKANSVTFSSSLPKLKRQRDELKARGEGSVGKKIRKSKAESDRSHSFCPLSLSHSHPNGKSPRLQTPISGKIKSN
jgi:hypothetical protein